MDNAATSPTLVGAFITAFLSLIGVVVWALRQQLSSSQKLIEVTIPQQQATFVQQMDKLSLLFSNQVDKITELYKSESQKARDYQQRQMEIAQEAFLNNTKEISALIKASNETSAANQRMLDNHGSTLDRHTQILEILRLNMPAPKQSRPQPPQP